MQSVVFLDACVLYSSMLSNLLFTLAERDVFSPRWSSAVLAELENALIDHAGITGAQASWRVENMTTTFPSARVAGYEHLENKMLCHPKDRHVLAAAVHGECDALMTFNLRDFPREAIEPFDIDLVSPDDFLLSVHEQNVMTIPAAVEVIVSSTNRPQLSENDVLDALEKAGLATSVAQLRRLRSTQSL